MGNFESETSTGDVKILEALAKCRAVYCIVSQTAVTAPFKPRGYASSAGRVDIIARCLYSLGFFPKSGSCLVAVLLGPPSPPKIIIDLEPSYNSEREAVIAISRALKESKSQPLLVGSVSPLHLLIEAKRLGFKLTVLRENGINALENPLLIHGRRFFLLGSQTDIPEEIELQALSIGADIVSVGPLSLHTEHVIWMIEWLRNILR